MPRIALVDAEEYAAVASSILREAWQPPCMLYSADYLAWQFSFPNVDKPLAVVAFEGDEAVAFVAAVPRQFRFRERVWPIWVSSFHSARHVGRGPAAVAVARALCRATRERRYAVLSFAEPGSTGEHLLVQASKAMGFSHFPLGTLRTHGCLAAAPAESADVYVEATVDYESFSNAAMDCGDPALILSSPDPEQFEHYGKDPRGRAAVVVRDTSGEPLAAAMLICSEVCTSQGIERVPSIDGIWTRRISAAGLKRLAEFAAKRFQAVSTSKVIMAPNLTGVDAAALRGAGFRATPAAFAGHLFLPDADSPLAQAAGTNFEII